MAAKAAIHVFEIGKEVKYMRKFAILASVWLVCTASLAFGAVAFGDGGRGDDGDHDGGGSGHCQYKKGKLKCDRDD